jgi:serine/threonine protein kinase
MIDVATAWFESGEYADIAGFRLRPVENPFLKGIPLILLRGQAQAFYLRDDNNLDWVLKKFLPNRHPGSSYIRRIEELIPHRPGFQSGYLRRILSEKDISKAGFFSESFASWIEDTVLMPKINHRDWAIVADRIRSGTLVLPNDERMLLCRGLSEQVNLLERSAISHRNLSCTNTLIDERTLSIHLIDWDEIFHPTLAMPHNASFGTCGYIAPFVYTSGYPPHAWISWRPQADRFSLAILNSEFLVLRPDSSLHGDGGIFNQDELCARGGEGIDQILNQLRRSFPDAEVLLKRALDARGFDDCPSPAEWLAFSSGVDVSFVDSGESMPPAKFYSCFIGYSHKDNEFAQRLHSRLRDAGLRVWFAP